MPIDRAALFAGVKPSLFTRFNQTQVDGINAIVDAFERAGATNPDWYAYGLATPYHETDKTMRWDIREYGLGKNKKYGKVGRHGQVAYGRGFSQITWDDNYEWADKALGLNGALLKNFDLALDKEISARILALGMIDGAFTGAPLARFFHGDICDPRDARKIINGMDCADTIAGYFRKFRKALVMA